MKSVWVEVSPNKKKFIQVPDEWKEGDDLPKSERPTGDLTGGVIKSLSFGMTKEQYDAIFNKES